MHLKHILAAYGLFFIGGLLPAEPLPFLWTGSWTYNPEKTTGSLINRMDGRVSLPFQTLSVRAQALDKRSAPPLTDFSAALPAFAGGLYHKATGSRLLYGTLDEWGLPARVRSPWIRAVPFVEYHRSSVSDLKTEPSSTKTPELYLYLRSPRIGIFNGFAALTLDEQDKAALSGGLDVYFDKKTALKLEAFYTGRELAARTSSTWFSTTPPLPERDFRLFAMSAVFTSAAFSIASDGAWSETSAFGRGVYGNLGITLGAKPWVLSVAVDGASERYVGRDGSVSGTGFRSAARIERFGKKSALFRLNTSLRASAFGTAFNRSSSGVYYRFPTGVAPFPLKITSIFLTMTRNAEDVSKVQDSYEAGIGIAYLKARASMTGTAHFLSPTPYPLTGGAFQSLKVSVALSARTGVLNAALKAGCLLQSGTDAIWSGSLSLTLPLRSSRLTLTAASTDFPLYWSHTLSWRLSY
jgi:hypothetical protein